MNRRVITSLVVGIASLIALAPASAQTAAPADAGPKKMDLQKIDTKVGTGKEAVAGNTVTVHYSGWLLDPKADKQHGMMFDSSVGDKPFTFPLGTGRVIKGWDQGVAGMKVGGKRTIIIPQDLGYGARGAGGRIPPYANLIFDIELLEVK